MILTPQELVEIRAAQRTFEGAYIRTSLGQFSFALVVLKIFTSEFYSIGRPSRIISAKEAKADVLCRRSLRNVWCWCPGCECVPAYAREQAIL